MQVSFISFGSARSATPFILKDLVKTGRVKLARDFYGNDILDPKLVTADHLKTFQQGGADTVDNLVLAIQTANTHRDRKPLKKVMSIQAAIEYLRNVAQIKVPEFDGEIYAESVRKRLANMDIFLDGLEKNSSAKRPVKTRMNRTKAHRDRMFKKF